MVLDTERGLGFQALPLDVATLPKCPNRMSEKPLYEKKQMDDSGCCNYGTPSPLSKGTSTSDSMLLDSSALEMWTGSKQSQF